MIQLENIFYTDIAKFRVSHTLFNVGLFENGINLVKLW